MTAPAQPNAERRPPNLASAAFADGFRTALGSVFFYVLIGNYLGIGALAHEYDFSVGWMLLSGRQPAALAAALLLLMVLARDNHTLLDGLSFGLGLLV